MNLFRTFSFSLYFIACNFEDSRQLTKVTGKRINRGGRYRLEVPCKYRISGQKKAVDWIKRKATTFLQEHSLAVNKMFRKEI